MNRKSAYKDMDKWKAACNRQRQRYYGKTSFLYERRPWDEYEDRMVIEHNLTDSQLSDLLERSVRAIQVRRSRLKNNIV